ncbi:enolase C-terminal domain-like protein [Tetragenococcus halophilus]|uniref:enolase C-terminal domain-like protein n=1 Tax=Tetragenococcus halophilus TaxID=51669 RepID=UPI00209A8132|nr:enolase C-terminal domain-like protein [Tetragenococcus halophilus]MCO8296340.1 glucarate dehydratase [Tetragenococcus halophilus]MDN6724416.1 glucarate dehydratase [Tetragenococcus halophilus]
MELPLIKKMEVYPVAGYDSMLMNLSGAHGPYFTRNIVLLTDNSDRVGIGEVPGGEKITDTLNDCKDLVVNQSIGEYKNIVKRIKERYQNLDTSGRGSQTFDLRTTVHVMTAVETPLLDLLGQFLQVPVAALLGDGQVREDIPFLGYLFYVGDKDKTDLPYIDHDDDSDEWGKLRRKEALTPEAIVALGKAVAKRYGFKDFKLKGGVLSGQKEMKAILSLKKEFPNARVTLDPNGAWSLEEAVELCQDKHGILTYVEDPCGAEDGFSSREIMSEFVQKTGLPTATNMVATDWRQMRHSVQLGSVTIPLADPHFWTMRGSVRVSQLCRDFGMTWGVHSNNHFDISLAMVAHTAAAAPGKINACDTHYIWQDGQALTQKPYKIENGCIHIASDSIGLGITPNIEAIEKAHQLYRDNTLGVRDDTKAMQYLIPNWKFDNKKPSLVR